VGGDHEGSGMLLCLHLLTSHGGSCVHKLLGHVYPCVTPSMNEILLHKEFKIEGV
jgi:hypothetical protein